MKAFVAGIADLSGISKKTQSRFEMTKLYVLMPIEIVNQEKFKKRGVGYEVAEYGATPEAVESFSKVKLPGIYELLTDVILHHGKMETVVVGVVDKSAVAA